MKKNVLEWTVFGISVAIIAAVAGLLLHRHFTAGDRPVDIVLTVGPPVASRGGYSVPIDVRNDGDTSAEDVHIAVKLGGAAGEEADLTIPFVPYRSSRRGWVMFLGDPGTARLDARVLGYREP